MHVLRHTARKGSPHNVLHSSRIIHTPSNQYLPVPTTRAERSAVRTSSTDCSRQENKTVKEREKHEAIDGLFAGIQPNVGEICCQNCSAERSGLGRKENTVKARSTTIIGASLSESHTCQTASPAIYDLSMIYPQRSTTYPG